MPKAKKKRAVVVFNTHRNIVFGYVEQDLDEHNRIKLSGARHCWNYVLSNTDDKGPHGLATVGPQEGSRVGPRVTLTACDVANVLECSEAAITAWESAKW